MFSKVALEEKDSQHFTKHTPIIPFVCTFSSLIFFPLFPLNFYPWKTSKCVESESQQVKLFSIDTFKVRVCAHEDPLVGGEGPQDQGGVAPPHPQDREDRLRTPAHHRH